MNDTVWISHRGLDEKYTENTRNAFEEAMDAGFRHLETDLRTTADGQLVLHHDPDLERTAGQAARIEDLHRSELAEVRFTDGQSPLLFEEFAEHFSNARWILDIKPESAPATLYQLWRWARETGNHDWLLNNARFLMWNKTHDRLLLNYFPEATTLANAVECRRAGMSILAGVPLVSRIRKNRTYSLPPRFMGRFLYKPDIFKHYHRKKARLLAYLPEKARDIERALEAGADEVLTNGRPLNL